jgi:hypothetical protein
MPEELEAFATLDAIKEALAQPDHIVDANKMAQPVQPEQKPVAKKWILHGSFADVASFDAEGFPSFYWNESVTKFKNGKLSMPCKGKNCGSPNGWLHSRECRAEHESHYTTPPAAQRPWQGLDEAAIRADEREACAVLAQQTICDTHIPTGINIYGTRAAKAIRARGNT